MALRKRCTPRVWPGAKCPSATVYHSSLVRQSQRDSGPLFFCLFRSRSFERRFLCYVEKYYESPIYMNFSIATVFLALFRLANVTRDSSRKLCMRKCHSSLETKREAFAIIDIRFYRQGPCCLRSRWGKPSTWRCSIRFSSVTAPGLAGYSSSRRFSVISSGAGRSSKPSGIPCPSSPVSIKISACAPRLSSLLCEYSLHTFNNSYLH